MKKIHFIFLLLGLSKVAYAQTLGDVADGLLNFIPGIIDVVSGLAYISSIGFFIKAALKLKEHTESKGQVKLHIPLIYFLTAVFLFTLPSLIGVGLVTLGLGTAGVAAGGLSGVNY